MIYGEIAPILSNRQNDYMVKICPVPFSSKAPFDMLRSPFAGGA